MPQPPKVLIVNSKGCHGGAARAAANLARGLNSQNADIKLLIQDGQSEISGQLKPKGKLEAVWRTLQPPLDALALRLHPRRTREMFSTAWVPGNLAEQVNQCSPDIINLHWANSGFLKLEDLSKFKAPIVWTLHDAWAFTGGCHVFYDCEKWIDRCGRCPQLGSGGQFDLSRLGWLRRSRIFQNLNLTVVAPSRWMAQKAGKSPLLQDKRIVNIPNGIDQKIFKPRNREESRKLLGLPLDRPIILTGTVGFRDYNLKGYSALEEILSNPQLRNSRPLLAVMGATGPELGKEPPIETQWLGTLQDDLTLSLAYNACNVFLCPSKFENLSMVVAEAASCGRPVLAFDVGGMQDVVDHGNSGWLSQPYDTLDIARRAAQLLNDTITADEMGERAHRWAEKHFELENVSRQHLELFTQLMPK